MDNDKKDIQTVITYELEANYPVEITLVDGRKIIAINPDAGELADKGVKEIAIDEVADYLTIYTSNFAFLYINKDAIVSVSEIR
ncbi:MULTISPECIES: hypothetical protein [Leuconostoc]|uniref:Uncharacterized protein n=1 Tax=Leuconostoc inhae TaxID=178001 RepID=A0AAN2QTH2_9LACO|nr:MULTISPECIES: hypothetical protein [Leuconostoc]MBZ5947143.1 hypothetical protein [Leuconostoc gasicomitatum]MBZ5955026.1 hypothetical protein [Leuconostoc gasicomitatum]MBZ5956186.1 hypothetical protein [Leuconostoc gasicomitatum]MBZ5959404.1 hypothetical protein [Leuconostoc gasicomitatum]MBZ5960017.1 hypothetical protein [Leuconostoc gasicomitatum]